jgi:hypothetical protein
MEELKEHEDGTSNVKGPSRELKYTFDLIVQLNNLAKTIVAFNPEV